MIDVFGPCYSAPLPPCRRRFPVKSTCSPVRCWSCRKLWLRKGGGLSPANPLHFHPGHPLYPRPPSLPSPESPRTGPKAQTMSLRELETSTSSSSTSFFNPCCTRRITKVGFAFSLCCSCFFRVTRQEAEEMLEANPENGGLIIRPSSVPNSYALSLRLLTARSPLQTNTHPFTFTHCVYKTNAVR